ncbi:fumarylacetoacetase [Kamptonema cortianum]|nr:fumarylacetoacetase [Geitlerinema splendidum]MDK3156924.1 fumarylacetoacetase [Kamptonema cortianum]
MKSFFVPANAKSWVEVAPESHFPIQNLPFGMAAPKGRHECVVVAIGEFALDITLLQEEGLLSQDLPYLDTFLGLDRETMCEVRQAVYDLLRSDNPALRDHKKLSKRALIPMHEANLLVPIQPSAFIDFYSGIHHAGNVGRMFRPDMEPLLPNYRHLPVGYNGRASSVVVSDTPIFRPKGQTKGPDDAAPTFGPSKEMDFELEMGYYIGHGNEMGKRITCKAAEEHVIGLVLVNDWSARDVQRWEYQPLGPFLSKSFATTVSPWIVSLDALEPFRIEGMEQDPEVLPHLRRQGKQHFDIQLEVALQSAKMKSPQVICRSNTKHLYWSIAQQIAHQSSNGTPLEFGDLYASGTISGPEEGEFGSMLELSWRGSKPITLEETGETRTFLEDGDIVTMTAYCQADGYRIGFGACSGKLLPAKD